MGRALEIAAAVRSGERSARSVAEEHLAAIEAREPEIHAFNLVTAADALAAADAVDARVARGEDPGPLAGVPVALKDNLCTRGVATTCSSRILEGWKPPYTATAVERVLAAAGDIAYYSEDRGYVAYGRPRAVFVIAPVDGPRPAAAGLEAACVSIGVVPPREDATLAPKLTSAFVEADAEKRAAKLLALLKSVPGDEAHDDAFYTAYRLGYAALQALPRTEAIQPRAPPWLCGSISTGRVAPVQSEPTSSPSSTA